MRGVYVRDKYEHRGTSELHNSCVYIYIYMCIYIYILFFKTRGRSPHGNYRLHCSLCKYTGKVVARFPAGYNALRTSG